MKTNVSSIHFSIQKSCFTWKRVRYKRTCNDHELNILEIGVSLHSTIIIWPNIKFNI